MGKNVLYRSTKEYAIKKWYLYNSTINMRRQWCIDIGLETLFIIND